MKRLGLLTVVAFAALSLSGNALSATFVVTKIDDTNDGVCDADCSLREAVRHANVTLGADTIQLGVDHYGVTIAGLFEDAAALGDLDVTDTLTITGAGRDATSVSANADRSFEVHAGATLTLENLTVFGGNPSVGLPPNDFPSDLDAESGGGIRNRVGATLILTDVDVVFGSAPRARAGGIFNQGTATLTRVEVAGNQSGEFFTNPQNVGGGIYNTGTLTILDSAIIGNSAHRAGGILNDNTGNPALGILTVRNSTVAANTKIGILNVGTLTLDYSTIVENTAAFNSGGPTALSNHGPATVSSSILTTPPGFSGPNTVCDPSASFAVTSGGHNVVQDSSCALTMVTDQQGVDAKLKNVSDYGGPTLTAIPLADSPAVGAGGSPAPLVDQRGRLRADGAPDSGAAERQSDDFFLGISFASDDEGDTGTRTLTFTVRLDSPNTVPVTVDWATSDGDSPSPEQNAVAPGDYQTANGTETFPIGDVEETVEVLINGDVDIEQYESFRVILSNPSGAQLQQPVAYGTIENDDFPRAVAFNDDEDRGSVSAFELDTIPAYCAFPVRLKGIPLTGPVSVKYRTIDSDAVGGSDYVAVLENTLTFTPGGPRQQEIQIEVLGDLLDEGDETFLVELYDPVGVELHDTLSDTPETSVDFPCVIKDNDDPNLPRTIRVSGGTVLESAGVATFTLTLDRARAGLTVDYTTEDGTALAGPDYLLRSGTATFGERPTLTIDVPLVNDTVTENPESFFLELSNPSAPGVFGVDLAQMLVDDDDVAVVTLSGATSFTGTSYPSSGGLLITMPGSRRSAITITAQVLCVGGSAPTAVTLNHLANSFAMTLIGPDHYRGTIPAAQVGNGPFTVSATCGGLTTTKTLGRIALYDPSGFITDADTGDPVVGATVTLYRVPGWEAKTAPDDVRPNTCQSNLSKPPGTAWNQPAPVAQGVEVDPVADAALIEPDLNPETTNIDGWYGWDVAAGCWFLRIEAAGYHSAFSPVVGVPTAVTDLDIELAPIVLDNAPPTVTLTPDPLANANGWWRDNVTVTVTADDGPGGSGVASITCGAVTEPDASLVLQITAEGETLISCTALDNENNNSDPVTLSVRIDRTPPDVTAPADLNQSTGSDPRVCSVVIDDQTLGIATSNDLHNGTLVRSGVPAGNVFPIGTTVVTYTGTDLAGNSAIATQDVTVTDGTPDTVCNASRGDVNADGAIDIEDVFYLANFLFFSGPSPIGSGDINGDTSTNAADLLYLISYLFGNGPAPPP